MNRWKWILFPVGWFILLLLVNQYLFCPQYEFTRTTPFSGPVLHNPYQGADFSTWKKCNFHTHVRAWGGLTNGTSTAEEAVKRYRALGYDVPCISNYQQIDTYRQGQPGYLEAYEHGFGICKNHHTVLGTRQILWKDYLFPQTLSNKQHLLIALQKTNSAFTIINHPANRKSFPPSDFIYLTGYDGIEVYPSGSQAAFDTALSSGRLASCMANDDSHDITDADEIGLNCTWVGSPTTDKEDILAALQAGKSYIMVVGDQQGTTMEDKIVRTKHLQRMKEVSVRNDSLIMSTTEPASFRFFGQHGKLLKAVNDSMQANYPIKPTDTYVRTRIFYKDGLEVNLNPVIRTNGTLPVYPLPEVNEIRTLIFRIAGFLVMAMITVMPFLLKRIRINR